ncbi:MAG: hypothetical protein QF614_08245, partial [SAR324 cluster bacterium]|nr:hypothetical protein [SAR324 cluster bacterium]
MPHQENEAGVHLLSKALNRFLKEGFFSKGGQQTQQVGFNPDPPLSKQGWNGQQNDHQCKPHPWQNRLQGGF